MPPAIKKPNGELGLVVDIVCEKIDSVKADLKQEIGEVRKDLKESKSVLHNRIDEISRESTGQLSTLKTEIAVLKTKEAYASKIADTWLAFKDNLLLTVLRYILTAAASGGLVWYLSQ